MFERLVSLQFCASIAGVFLLIGLGLSGSAAEAEEPVRSSAEILRCGETTCTVFRVYPAKQQLQIFVRDETGQRFRNAAAIKVWATKNDQKLRFATNIGIFDRSINPLGLLVQNHVELQPLNRSNGTGNFFLQPNGVFYVADGKAGILATRSYPPTSHIGTSKISLATQSGPLLLEEGRINPLFTLGSRNQLLRSGVGVSKPRPQETEAIFVISNGPINFYDFANFFKEKVGCESALYLDGVISRFYLSDINRQEDDGDFSGLFAVLEPVVTKHSKQ